MPRMFHPHTHCRWCSHYQARQSKEEGKWCQFINWFSHFPPSQALEMVLALSGEPEQRGMKWGTTKTLILHAASARMSCPLLRTHCRWYSYYQARQSKEEGDQAKGHWEIESKRNITNHQAADSLQKSCKLSMMNLMKTFRTFLSSLRSTAAA